MAEYLSDQLFGQRGDTGEWKGAGIVKVCAANAKLFNPIAGCGFGNRSRDAEYVGNT